MRQDNSRRPIQRCQAQDEDLPYLLVLENIKKALPCGSGRIVIFILISDSRRGSADILRTRTIPSSSSSANFNANRTAWKRQPPSY